MCRYQEERHRDRTSRGVGVYDLTIHKFAVPVARRPGRYPVHSKLSTCTVKLVRPAFKCGSRSRMDSRKTVCVIRSQPYLGAHWTTILCIKKHETSLPLVGHGHANRPVELFRFILMTPADEPLLIRGRNSPDMNSQAGADGFDGSAAALSSNSGPRQTLQSPRDNVTFSGWQHILTNPRLTVVQPRSTWLQNSNPRSP